jgi:hypothetical protein
MARSALQSYGRAVAGIQRRHLQRDVPMTRLEIRVAALQHLSLRLCAALSLPQLEEIRLSALGGAKAADSESLRMQAEFLRLLDDAIERARQVQATTGAGERQAETLDNRQVR